VNALFVRQNWSARHKRLFSAKGAASVETWGNAPGIPIAVNQALKARFNRMGFTLLLLVNRAFSANNFLCHYPWGVAPGSAVNGAPLALNRYRRAAGGIRRDEQPPHNERSRRFSEFVRAAGALTLLLLLAGCDSRKNAVSGTIEVDEAHVGPRSGGRVEKILAWEGDRLHEGQVIVQLDASELRARRDLAAAQIDTAVHDADAQEAQLVFLRDEAKRQQDLLQRRVVSSTDAERADSSAKSQEKNVAAAKMRVAQARAQLADIDAQLAEMQVVAPADSILEVLSVKVGDVLPANREAATLLLTGHLWVRVYVPESWLGLIKLGEQVRVRVDSFPHTDFDGVVEQINRQAEFTPRNVQTVADRIKQVFGVKIRLPSEDDRLRAGMAADVYFPRVK
jgi:HlyD family secretion protein